jgi:excisionase family DNA binding protein
MATQDDSLTKVAYSVKEAAVVLGVGNTKLWEEINAGHLRARRLGARVLIPAAEIEAWLAALPEHKPRLAA